MFETGETHPSVLEAQMALPEEDQRRALSWGRTLISLADTEVEYSLRGDPKSKPPTMLVQSALHCGWYTQQGQTFLSCRAALADKLTLPCHHHSLR